MATLLIILVVVGWWVLFRAACEQCRLLELLLRSQGEQPPGKEAEPEYETMDDWWHSEEGTEFRSRHAKHEGRAR